MKFRDLTLHDSGRYVTLRRTNGEILKGQIFYTWSTVTKRRGFTFKQWYLSVPSRLPQFTHDAISLQWEDNETEVE